MICYKCESDSEHKFHDDGDPNDPDPLSLNLITSSLKFAVAAQRHPIYDEFQEAYALVEGKASDYAEDDNVFSNFEFAANAAEVTVGQIFLSLIGVKMARLQQLIGNDKTPNNESIDDTLLDLMNYAGLLKAYRRKKIEDLQRNSENTEPRYSVEAHEWPID